MCDCMAADLPFARAAQGLWAAGPEKTLVKIKLSLWWTLELSKFFELLKLKQTIPSTAPVTVYNASEAGK